MADLTTAATEILGQTANDPLVDQFGNILTDEDEGIVITPPTVADAFPLMLGMRLRLHA